MNNKIEFDSQDKCVKCGALRPLFKTHCQTESCKELRRRPKKTINQQIEQSLNKLTHKTGRLSIRTNSNGAKHYNEGGNDELAMSKSISCKNIDDIVQQIQNTLDYSNSLQELFKSDLKMNKCIKCNRKDEPDQFLNGLCPRCDDEKEFIPEDF